jgi:hypothetical protein
LQGVPVMRKSLPPSLAETVCQGREGRRRQGVAGGPALQLHDIPPIDAVLLSHEDHVDNLDPLGRQLTLETEVPKVGSLGPAVVNVFRSCRAEYRIGEEY